MRLPFRAAIAKTPRARARLRAKLDRVMAQLAEGRAKTRAEIRAEIRRLRRFEQLLQAYGGFRARAPMPPIAGWAIDRPGLVGLVALIEEHRPRLVVELGSGVSSVWMGYVVQRTGGRLLTFDHLDKYADLTREALTTHGLDEVVQVRTAYLHSVSLGGVEYQWYDPHAFADLDGIDLLVVDGPPGITGPAARYPALGVLANKLAPNAIVVLDDVNREEEQHIMHRWLDEVEGLSPPRPDTGRQAVLHFAGRI